MVDTVYGVNAVSGAPSYSGKQYRQANSSAYAGATAARPLGGRTGVRPGTSTSTVTATSTVWTCGPFAGVADVETAVEASVYPFAFDANETGAVTAAHATLARKDIIYVQIDDPAESDGSSVPLVKRKYLAGTASGSPVAPATPVTRAFVIAVINVPASGGGSPTVTWVAPYAVAAGGIVPFTDFANLNLWTTASSGQYADVFGDATPANNGLYRWDGGAWQVTNRSYRTTGSGSLTAVSTSIASLALPAGTWRVTGRGYFNVSTVAARQYQAELYNLTTTTQIEVAIYGPNPTGAWPVVVEEIVTLSAPATIQLRVNAGVLDGTQLFSNGKLFAQKVAAL